MLREFNKVKDIKVLIVEDEIIVAADLKHQLQKLDLNVLKPVSKGEKAVEVADKERPDLILMDIILSNKMNGLEAAYKILSIYNPVIIFISGFIDEKISEKINSLQAFKLYKPFQVKDLINVIEKNLSRIIDEK